MSAFWARATLAATLALVASSLRELAAQEFLWTKTDGTRVGGKLVAITNPGGAASYRIQSGSEAIELRASDLVAAHLVGGAVAMGGAAHPPATVLLVGGDRLAGEVRGGEGSGETFTFWSSSLGERAVAVDRLRAVLLAGAGPEVRLEDLRVPEGAKAEEALFRATRRGFDTIVGSIDRFTRSGVAFQSSDASAPQEFAFATILGIAVRSGQASKETLAARVLTRAGDHVAATPLSATEERVVLQLEGKQQVSVPLNEIVALTLVGGDRTFLSDLQPAEVEERSYYGGTAVPLYPFQRDRSVGGGTLTVGGMAFGKGLGVHSRSRLTYVVPEGRTRFHAVVGYDDEVKLLAWERPKVDVRVFVGDKAVANLAGLRAGDPAQNLGVLPVQPGQRVTLEVDFGPDADHADRVDWLDAVFLR